jgi:hypothetical protein
MERDTSPVLLCVVLAVFLGAGCASVPTLIPRDEYCALGQKTVRVTTMSEEIYGIGVRCADSTLTLARAQYPEYDRRNYPLDIPMQDIDRVETIRAESLVYVETGVEYGVYLAGEAPNFSPTLYVTEIGYLSGERKRDVRPRWGFGGSLFLSLSNSESFGGIKGRARYRLNDTWSFDATTGPLVHSWELQGWMFGAGVNLGRYVTFRSEYVAHRYEAWREPGQGAADGYTYYDAGTEHVWYNGVALRNGAGWLATGVGVVALFAAASALAAGLAASN